jgi:hypothetical protein
MLYQSAVLTIQAPAQPNIKEVVEEAITMLEALAATPREGLIAMTLSTTPELSGCPIANEGR